MPGAQLTLLMRIDVFTDGSSATETSRVQSGAKLPIENVSFQHRNIIPSSGMISVDPLFSAPPSSLPTAGRGSLRLDPHPLPHTISR
jgi:hypothetical protein